MGKRNTKNGNGNGNHYDVLVEDIKSNDKLPSDPLGKKLRIKHKTPKQKDFTKMIDEHDITLCSGPAGCGKSYLSLMKALQLLQTPKNGYDKLYIITPTVEITKNGLGFLPGSFNDKISVYMNSVYRLIDKMIGKIEREELLKDNIIEVLGLGYIRGDNFDNCVLIVEESQNISKKEMLTILTRIGYKCKMVISGDIMQIDQFKYEEDSGLYHAINNLGGINELGIFEFDINDVVRNKIITKILQKY